MVPSAAVPVLYETVPVALELESVSDAVRRVTSVNPPCSPPPPQPPPPVLVGVANEPLSVPTVIAVPAVTDVGKFAGKAVSLESGLLDSTSLPAPLASVVIVPTSTPPTDTS